MITVVVAVGLLIGGAALAWPVPQVVDLLEPVWKITSGFGLPATAETGWLALFAGDALLVAGCLVPGL
jgi:hypothetical protein